MSRSGCPAELVAAARAAGISDERVLAAMNATPRAGFVPARYVTAAYRDEPIPIGHGQMTTQPSLSARMIEGLRLAGSDHVLEIGTGLGFQTALLARGERAGATVACRARVAARAHRADRSACTAPAHKPLIRLSSSADRSDIGANSSSRSSGRRPTERRIRSSQTVLRTDDLKVTLSWRLAAIRADPGADWRGVCIESAGPRHEPGRGQHTGLCRAPGTARGRGMSVESVYGSFVPGNAPPRGG
jgi:hypothetical protein